MCDRLPYDFYSNSFTVACLMEALSVCKSLIRFLKELRLKCPNQTQPKQIRNALGCKKKEQVTGACVTHSVLVQTRERISSHPVRPVRPLKEARRVPWYLTFSFWVTALCLSDTWRLQSSHLSPSRLTTSTEQTERTHCLSSKTMETVLHEKPRRDPRSTDKCVQRSKRSPTNGKWPSGTGRRGLIALKQRAQ